MIARLLVLIVTLSSLCSAQARTARDTLADLRKTMRSAHESKDYPAMKKAASEIRAFVHNAPGATYDLACAAALSGDKEEAFRLLNELADTRQSFPIDKDDDLASLKSDPRFSTILNAMKRSLEPVETSKTFAVIDPKDLLTEDLAYDPHSDSFFLTSVLKKKVYGINRRRPDKTAVFADLSSSPGWPLLAVAADPTRSILWATASALPGFAPANAGDAGKTLLLKLDLKTGHELARYSPLDTVPRALGDMTLLRDGTVIVSDGLGGGVYRLKPSGKTLEPVDRGEFISPQTPAATPDGRYAFVPDYVRGIGRIDLTTGEILWLEPAAGVTATGIDGLYLHGNSFIAIQNGTNPERLVRLQLDPEMLRLTKMDVLESNSPDLGDPTHGTFIGDKFYFIANSGWDVLDNKGTPKPGRSFSSPSLRLLVAAPK